METIANQLLESTIKKIHGAYAESTIRAYRVDFEQFIKYCEENHESALPASPETICKYIQKLIQDGKSSASIRRLMACMTTIHKLNRFQDPTKDPANIKWMEDQIQAAKKVHGDTFGEDIEDTFEE
jgi:site-specific recombinase XerD